MMTQKTFYRHVLRFIEAFDVAVIDVAAGRRELSNEPARIIAPLLASKLTLPSFNSKLRVMSAKISKAFFQR